MTVPAPGPSRAHPIINALGGLGNPNAPKARVAAAGIRPEADGVVIDARTLTEAHQSGLSAVNITLGHIGGDGDEDPMGLTIADIRQWDELLAEHSTDLTKVLGPNDLWDAHQAGRIGLIYGFQNATMFGEDLDRVAVFADLGVRIAQLTYNPRNQVGAGCMAYEDTGLSSFGRRLVRRLNDHHLMVDLSHSSERTCLDAVDVSAAPISINHTGCRALVDVPRNKTDQELRLVAEAGGFVGIYFMPFVSTSGHATARDVVDHLCHAVDVCGIERVGIGTDGTVTGIDDLDAYRASLAAHVEERRRAGIGAVGERADTYPFVEDLRGPGQFARLATLLEARGFDTQDVDRILGLNFIEYAERIWASPTDQQL